MLVMYVLLPHLQGVKAQERNGECQGQQRFLRLHCDLGNIASGEPLAKLLPGQYALKVMLYAGNGFIVQGRIIYAAVQALVDDPTAQGRTGHSDSEVIRAEKVQPSSFHTIRGEEWVGCAWNGLFPPKGGFLPPIWRAEGKL